MSDLAERSCTPCRGGTPPLSASEVAALLARLGPDGNGWQIVAAHDRPRQIEKEFRFPDFKSALAFVDRVGATAEAEGHHPDVFLAWGRVRLTIWTHAVDGLSESDFVLAAKADREFAEPIPSPGS